MGFKQKWEAKCVSRQYVVTEETQSRRVKELWLGFFIKWFIGGRPNGYSSGCFSCL